MSTATEEFRVQMDAPQAIQPGVEGWWQVWGARTRHVRPGDIIVLKRDDSDPESPLEYHEVSSAKDEFVWMWIQTTDGEKFHLGALYSRFLLFRRGTHNTLFDP